jgi:signal transduction histidine kinase
MGQHLSAIVVGLKSLEGSAPADGKARLQQLRALAETAARDAHHLALELRPAALDDLGLLAGLQNYIDEWAERWGVTADFDASAVDGLLTPSPIDSCVYRVIQEALNNVAKHAGAKHVGIVLTVEHGWLHIVIEDDGVGFDLNAPVNLLSEELGLVGIRERVTLSDGTMLIESAPGQGTAMFVRLPLPPKPARREHLLLGADAP